MFHLNSAQTISTSDYLSNQSPSIHPKLIDYRHVLPEREPRLLLHGRTSQVIDRGLGSQRLVVVLVVLFATGFTSFFQTFVTTFICPRRF